MNVYIDADSTDAEIIEEAKKIGLPVTYVQLNTLLPDGENCAEVHVGQFNCIVVRRFKIDAHLHLKAATKAGGAS